MGQLENNLRIRTERALTKWQRLFRVNSGCGWVGKTVKRGVGFITLLNPRPFFGMPKGTPDMIGFDSILITPDMVGKRVAVFVGSELKATKKDQLKKDQTNFKNMLVGLGGIHREHREDGQIIESKDF